MSTLRDPQVQQVLKRLHAAARAQQPRRFGLGLGIGRRLRRLRGGTPSMQAIAEQGSEAYLSISPTQGELLYALLRLCGARQVVEFGTSFGVSTIYLAAAVRDNGGGSVIGTELLASKAAVARDNLSAAGLSSIASVRVGDAASCLRGEDGAVDVLFLDGHKALYEDIFALVTPRLRSGGLVVADNIFTFPDELRSYVRMVKCEAGFWSMVLPLGGGMAITVKNQH
jgi:predicted O-methyltransferase YrrM